MSAPVETVKGFCLIQLQVLRDRVSKLRKEILNCKIQEEFLTKTLEDLSNDDGTTK
jgi:hypothetical protein